MASWQPPIPAGALYSKPARALGPALPLLAYCYDKVGRDGSFRLSLKEVAGDMDEPYPTVKRWWQMLIDGPFFKAVESHGRNGLEITFKPIWLDWRILRAREEKPDPFTEETGSEMISNNGTPVEPPANQSTIGIINGTETGSEMISDDKCNKVLITTDQAILADAAFAAPPPPANKPKKQKHNPTDHKRLMQLYADALPDKRIPNGGREAKAASEILAAGYTPEQALQVYAYLKQQQFHATKHLSLSTVNTEMGAALDAIRNGRQHNGSTNRQPVRPHPGRAFERAKWTEDG